MVSKLKKLLLTATIVLSLSGCNLTTTEKSNSDWYKITTPEKIAKCEDEYDILCFVGNNIEYKTHGGKRCFYAQETLDKGYGDCDDKSILDLAIYKLEFGKEGSLLILEDVGNDDYNGHYHAEPDFNGKTFYDKDRFKLIKEYSWDEMTYYPYFNEGD